MLTKINSTINNLSYNQQMQNISSRPYDYSLKGTVLNFRKPLDKDTVSFGRMPAVRLVDKHLSSNLEESTIKAFNEVLGNLSDRLIDDIKSFKPLGDPKKIRKSFNQALNPKSEIFKDSVGDLEFILEKDPALKSKDEKEAILYPSLLSTFAHRVSHNLYKGGNSDKLLARAISEATKRFTGAEIHPGAKIGKQIFIDHPTGLIVGETTTIGDRFHGHGQVLLGSNGINTGPNRHPIVGNDVTIWPKASLHGPIEIGDGSIIGSNSVLTENVPPKSIIVGHNMLVKLNGKKIKMDLKQYWHPSNSDSKASSGNVSSDSNENSNSKSNYKFLIGILATLSIGTGLAYVMKRNNTTTQVQKI